jgi:hypothetical protein
MYLHTCPICERPLKNPNQWHNCVKVNIDDLFKGKKEELVYVFDQILAEIIDWEGVAASATQNCIVFVRTQTFLIIRPMKKELDIKFYLPEKSDSEQIFKSTLYGGKWEHHIRLSELEQLSDEVFSFLRKSYEMF